jgi:hypothetical protein
MAGTCAELPWCNYWSVCLRTSAARSSEPSACLTGLGCHTAHLLQSTSLLDAPLMLKAKWKGV